MTVLQALAGHYDRLAAKGEAPSYGFSRERISYAIVLSPQGKVVDVTPLLDTSGKKPRPTLRQVPQPVKRTSATAANFLWDKTAYAFGVKRSPNTKQLVLTEHEHATFKKLHADILNGTEDEGLRALLVFLNEWRPETYDNLRHAEDMLDTNVVFRLDGEQRLLHDRPVAKTVWAGHLAQQDSVEGLCLITGERAPIARLHPPVKGVMKRLMRHHSLSGACAHRAPASARERCYGRAVFRRFHRFLQSPRL